jgi:hypothetical protein
MGSSRIRRAVWLALFTAALSGCPGPEGPVTTLDVTAGATANGERALYPRRRGDLRPAHRPDLLVYLGC